MKRRHWILSVSFALAAIFCALAFRLPGARRPSATWADVLWVVDRDWRCFYPPHSRESQALLTALARYGLDASAAAPGNGCAVLYRSGLTNYDDPEEPMLLILPPHREE